MSLTARSWLLWGQVLFVVSGAIWLFMLVPIQSAQSRMTALLAESDAIPEAYRRPSRHWIVWGIVATVPMVAALNLMVMKY